MTKPKPRTIKQYEVALAALPCRAVDVAGVLEKSVNHATAVLRYLESKNLARQQSRRYMGMHSAVWERT